MTDRARYLEKAIAALNCDDGSVNPVIAARDGCGSRFPPCRAHAAIAALLEAECREAYERGVKEGFITMINRQVSAGDCTEEGHCVHADDDKDNDSVCCREGCDWREKARP